MIFRTTSLFEQKLKPKYDKLIQWIKIQGKDWEVESPRFDWFSEVTGELAELTKTGKREAVSFLEFFGDGLYG